MLLLSNPPSISPVVCITGRFVDGVFMKLVDVWIASVFSSLLVMFISSLESFWILLRFCLSGSWMVFPFSWLLVDKGSPCTEAVFNVEIRHRKQIRKITTREAHVISPMLWYNVIC